MKISKDPWVHGDKDNAKTFADLLKSTKTSKISTVDCFEDGCVRSPSPFGPGSNKDATTGLNRQDTVQKDPVVKIFRMTSIMDMNERVSLELLGITKYAMLPCTTFFLFLHCCCSNAFWQPICFLDYRCTHQQSYLSTFIMIRIIHL
jgi:hypothetical protein